jgi:eukaryotic-like serine/threonine-protein kinase
LDSQLRGVLGLRPLPGGRGALVTSCNGGCVESDLRVIDFRSGEVRILADDGLQGWYVASGDVVFARRDGGVFSAPFDLKTLAFRSAPVPVLNGVRANGAAADMVLSPNGTLVYVAGSSTGSRGVEAVWVTRDDVASLVDSSWNFIESGGGGVALSPTGDRLAVAAVTPGGDDIWIKQLPAGPFNRLTFTGVNERPFWTADGRSVGYLARKPESNHDLVMQRADGSGAPVTILDAEDEIDEAIRTPDTARFVIRLDGKSEDLHVVTRVKDSAASIPLVVSEGYDERSPALSPDGRYLAYTSNESGRFEVFVRPYPNADGGKWQVSRDGGEEVRWSHSGRELFYRNGKRELVAANVTLGATFVLGEQRALFSAAGYLRSGSNPRYDVAPDDRRFVFLRFVGTGAGSGGASSDPLTVIKVDNWLRELKAGGARR